MQSPSASPQLYNYQLVKLVVKLCWLLNFNNRANVISQSGSVNSDFYVWYNNLNGTNLVLNPFLTMINRDLE